MKKITPLRSSCAQDDAFSTRDDYSKEFQQSGSFYNYGARHGKTSLTNDVKFQQRFRIGKI